MPHAYIWLYISIARSIHDLADFRLGDTSGNTSICPDLPGLESPFNRRFEGAFVGSLLHFWEALDGQEIWEERTCEG